MKTPHGQPGMVTLEEVARVCHEANRAYCLALGDTSQLPWDQAPEWQRQSCINGVRFNYENPGASPSATHDNWLAEKLADGWGYGEVKDPEKKTHPCCVPYDQLPFEQRRKDMLFQGVIRALLAPLVTAEALHIDGDLQ